MDNARLGHLSLYRIRSEAASDARDLRRLLGHYHIYENVCDHLAKVSFKTRQSRVDDGSHRASYQGVALSQSMVDVQCSAEEVSSDTDSDTDSDSDSDSDDDVEAAWWDDMAVCKNEETTSQNPYLPGLQTMGEDELDEEEEEEEDRASIINSVEIDCHCGEFPQPVLDTDDPDSSDEAEMHNRDRHQTSSSTSSTSSTSSSSSSSASSAPSSASSTPSSLSSTESSSPPNPLPPPSSPLSTPPQVPQSRQRPKPPTRHSTSNLHTVGLTLTIAAPKSIPTPNSTLASQLRLCFSKPGWIASCS